MSGSATHFRNEVMRLLARGLKCKHHSTQAYCSWSYGAVERLGKEILRACRALIYELELHMDSWPDLVPIIQSIVNHSPSPQRSNIDPVTVFTRLPPPTPIKTFMQSDTSALVSVNDALVERAVNIKELISTMEKLRLIVHEAVSARRERAREHLSKGRLPNFPEGDYVLMARDDFFKREKLCLRWRGPRRIVKVHNDHVFDVEDLRNGEIDLVHGSRLKFYNNPSLDEEVIMLHVLSSETGTPVARPMKLVKVNDDLMVQVRWNGLSAKEDNFEPLQNVFEDVPQMLERLLKRKSTLDDMARQARDALDL